MVSPIRPVPPEVDRWISRAGWLRWYAFDPLALDLKATALAAIAFVLAFVLHRGLIEVVVAMAALGIAQRLLLGA